MNRAKAVILALVISTAGFSGANAQGLLGELYTGVGAGYERFRGLGESVDGWGAGASVNLPVLREPGRFGLDVDTGIDYLRGTQSGLRFSATQAGPIARAYVPIDENLKVFAGGGIRYTRLKLSGFGISGSESSFYVPIEGGIEFVTGPISLTPFVRYSFATENNWNDIWTVGGTAAQWFDIGWGAALTISHSDYDGFKALSIRAGLLFAF